MTGHTFGNKNKVTINKYWQHVKEGKGPNMQSNGSPATHNILCRGVDTNNGNMAKDFCMIKSISVYA